MPKAEIITIGTELLPGEIVDTNSRFIARTLRDQGVDLYWTSTVGDNEERIADAIRQGMARSEIIITTGGLGPTVDDPTRNAVALALGVETEYRPELWEQIQARFRHFGRQPTENNKRQAFVPGGAIAIENPLGTAPAFIAETQENAIISLPGVPHEMEHLMKQEILPYLQKRFKMEGIIKARVLHTAGVGESQIDELITDLEKGSNPTVGLAAHAGQVDVRITAKAAKKREAEKMIDKVETTLRERLGDWVYGADEEKLETVALQSLSKKGWRLVVVEAGLGGRMIQRLAEADGPFLGGEALTNSPTAEELLAASNAFREDREAEACLGIALHEGEKNQTLHLAIITPIKQRTLSRSYGLPPQLAAAWATNLGLNLIRRLKGQ